MSITIFDIQRFSVQDGPGIRTTVFLKGCSMRCRWCHNPESLSAKPNLLFYREKCVECGLCGIACPAGAHQFTDKGHCLERNFCISCGECTTVCSQKALEIAGYEADAETIIKRIKRDRDFYNESGGGVTFSGGEPLLQADQLQEILKECKELRIQTAVETCSNVPWENFAKLSDMVDLWICDLKAVTESVHKRGTGCSNQQILENLKKMAEKGRAPIWIRVPIIPEFNDKEEEIIKIADFIRALGEQVQRVEVMAYHDGGRSKYEALGMKYPMGERKSFTKDEIRPFREKLEWKRGEI